MDDHKNEDSKEKDSDQITEKEQTEVNHFSMFMFGTNHRSIRKEQIEQIQLNEEVSSNNRQVKVDAWILGRGNDNTKKQIEEENTNFDAIANFLNQVDLELLMNNVDLFMTSANDLKPLFKKITPFLKKWMD